jgi:hypothetical protein
MKTEGEDYSTYLSDVINDHKSKTIKAVSSYLLQVMCEKHHALSVFVINYCLELSDFQIKGADVSTFTNYKNIGVDDVIFKLTDAEHQIETSFLIFCALTGQVIKHDELK